MRIYNTLSRATEEFVPQTSGKVSMYHCGPTVYDTPHIGNLRTVVSNDIVRRTFEFLGYDVFQVMNLTDVDDKTIRGAQEKKVSLHEFTRVHEYSFFEACEDLNVRHPHRTPRATEYIQEMIDLIVDLLERKHAYISSDGVYFSIQSFPSYGDLARLSTSSVVTRSLKDEYSKENPQDFALWKFNKPEDGDAVWEAPFGNGRPGWHIECSAMALSLIGNTVDIHTGAEDLIFPHHTNEIAQSESHTHTQFVRYWMHMGFVNVGKEKMAKSKHNFLTLDSIRGLGFEPLDFRYLTLTTHYRNPSEITEESLSSARQARKRLVAFLQSVHDTGVRDSDYHQAFVEALEDDINMPQALAVLWRMIHDDSLKPSVKKATLLEFDAVLGLRLQKTSDFIVPDSVKELVAQRDIARSQKDWALSDTLRNHIQEKGFTVKDTDEGSVVIPL